MNLPHIIVTYEKKQWLNLSQTQNTDYELIEYESQIKSEGRPWAPFAFYLKVIVSVKDCRLQPIISEQ